MGPAEDDRVGTLGEAWSRSTAIGRDAIKDTIAGLVASVVLIANIVSFGALMFPGDLSAGIPVAIWSMLIGSCVAGAWIAVSTSLPPLATGIDSPTGAVLVLLSALTASEVRAAGHSDIDKAGFFGPGDDPYVYVSLLADAIDEVLPVIRFPNGRGC